MNAENKEKGAAAVEFALVVPLLLTLIFGIILFGHAFSVQISLTQAARAAARSMAVENSQASAEAAGRLNIVGLDSAGFSYSPTSCAKDLDMVVTVSYNLTGFWVIPDIPISSKASMRCGG
ncbi:TadE/TadG family type IV pilus assembly protein [Arthrobacter sp. HY1533]|uniref:TadE/TadG family type IV pilus assembly protein n=1 Tax=Arthrobacter sp. HY1533 TaxID=2970919 RepID=UPI0022B9E579|nr:TadE family protein [Arthrobacter sp. HY1533]